MTAAKVMDVVTRLPGCAGQEADAVSAHTLVKLEDALSFSQFQSQNVQIFRHVEQDTNGQIHRPAWKNQSFHFSEINPKSLLELQKSYPCMRNNTRKKFYKIVTKNRSQTMRLFPTSTKVAFDWKFDRINLDLKGLTR